MKESPSAFRRALVMLFMISGFSGLIYESIWTQYLKLFLGHAAYAQLIVLSIFMGGMALGAFAVGHFGARICRALQAYALVELMVGILAISFHFVYMGVTSWTFDSLLPAVQSTFAGSVAKFAIAAILILPASVLLGATFPLMSAGVMRATADPTGQSLPLLYFANSFGAAFGVLVAGFALIGRFGLPGTILTAGIVNITLALIVWALAKRIDVEPDAAVVRAARGAENGVAPVASVTPRTTRCIAYAAAMVTGVSSFILEISWIRMLSTAIGSSTQSFEVMLSAFIMGIALGGICLSALTNRIRNRRRLLIRILLSKSVLSLVAFMFYPSLLDFVGWQIAALAKSEGGYLMYLLGSYSVSSLMMFPVAFCAGISLPLISMVLLETGEGERAVAGVYAWNTLGAIVGTIFAVYFGMEWFGVKGCTVVASLLDLGAGVALAAGLAEPQNDAAAAGWRRWGPILAIGALAAVFTLGFQLDSLKVASGVFRHGVFLSRSESYIDFYRDGRTATVAVGQTGEVRHIRTNGKVDAAVSVSVTGPPTPDESTMTLAAILPFVHHPGIRRVANIGFGSGLTSHELLGNPDVERVDSIEIERQILEGARTFGARNRRAYEDPRSQLIVEDAKTYFSLANAKYDLIVSEPSNPWISGVATLFSTEFYGRVRRHLNEDGLFVQWLQLYETNSYLVASILKALGSSYEDYVAYSPNPTELLIIAKPKGRLAPASGYPFSIPVWRASLARLNIRGLGDLQDLAVAGKDSLDRYARTFPAPANSDFFPFVDLHAPRERFIGANALELARLRQSFVPVVSVLGDSAWQGVVDKESWGVSVPEKLSEGVLLRRDLAKTMMAALQSAKGAEIERLPSPHRERAALIRSLRADCDGPSSGVWVEAVRDYMRFVMETASPGEVSGLMKQFSEGRCTTKLDPVGRKRLQHLQSMVDRDFEVMRATADALLSEPDFAQLAPAEQQDLARAATLAATALGDVEGAIRRLLRFRQLGFWADEPQNRLLEAYLAFPKPNSRSRPRRA